MQQLFIHIMLPIVTLEQYPAIYPFPAIAAVVAITAGAEYDT